MRQQSIHSEAVTMRILLVDDDPIFTALITEKLAEMDLDEITVAYSAEDALDLVARERVPFDCYLLDIMLGGMDGIELCTQLRNRRECRAAPIIMITSGTEERFMERAFEAGATDFLRKPIEQTEIVGRIKSAMQLVETLKKEKQGRHALRALISFASDFDLIDLTERVRFPEVDGMVDYYQIENSFLRMKEGLYQMHLFRVRVRNFTALNNKSKRADILQQLQAISATISQTATAQRFQFAYIGRGCFVCCVIGRHYMIPDLFQLRLRQNATQALQNLPACDSLDVKLDVSEISSKRILSREDALTLLSKELQAVTAGASAILPNVDTIEHQIFSLIKEEGQKLLVDR
ncbi:response regulator [Lentibacter sp. XHP0401]|uniref:response regulator n=1 Tax=Lentibacter sp. XHP0401 TaxID=2984334 RepID=UPI0021E8AD0E|nr:response regulator [Lentibacter sp. XHP0401]MCV2894236.1 response regulator [Lentibacter sp. XHP0401]